jgi:hypothetical protein
MKMSRDLRCCMSEESFVQVLSSDIGTALAVGAEHIHSVRHVRPEGRTGEGWVTFDVEQMEDPYLLAETFADMVVRVAENEGPLHWGQVTRQIDSRVPVEWLVGGVFVPLGLEATNSRSAASSLKQSLQRGNSGRTLGDTSMGPIDPPVWHASIPRYTSRFVVCLAGLVIIVAVAIRLIGGRSRRRRPPSPSHSRAHRSYFDRKSRGGMIHISDSEGSLSELVPKSTGSSPTPFGSDSRPTRSPSPSSMSQLIHDRSWQSLEDMRGQALGRMDAHSREGMEYVHVASPLLLHAQSHAERRSGRASAHLREGGTLETSLNGTRPSATARAAWRGRA